MSIIFALYPVPRTGLGIWTGTLEKITSKEVNYFGTMELVTANHTRT